MWVVTSDGSKVINVSSGTVAIEAKDANRWAIRYSTAGWGIELFIAPSKAVAEARLKSFVKATSAGKPSYDFSKSVAENDASDG